MSTWSVLGFFFSQNFTLSLEPLACLLELEQPASGVLFKHIKESQMTLEKVDD